VAAPAPAAAAPAAGAVPAAAGAVPEDKGPEGNVTVFPATFIVLGVNEVGASIPAPPIFATGCNDRKPGRHC